MTRPTGRVEGKEEWVHRELVDQAKRGDEEAFDALARLVGDRCMAIACRILRDADRAEDAVQAALITAWRELRTLRDPDRFEPWLHRILTNECYAEARRRNRWSANIRLLPVEGATEAVGILTVNDRDQLERAFRRLTLEQRAVLVFHHYLGLRIARSSGSSRHSTRDGKVPPAPRDGGPQSERRRRRQDTLEFTGATRMTAPRDPDVLIRAFLDEGQTDLPDRAFDAVRRDIHQTRQRVVIGPWRKPNMNVLARVAIAAAVVVAVGLAWVNFGPGQPGPGEQPPPTQAASPTPSPRGLPVGDRELPLEGGASYITQDPFLVRVTFTAPDGWEGKVGAPYLAFANPTGRDAPSYGVDFAIFDKVLVDPCQFDQGFKDVLPKSSVDALVTALMDVPGFDASTPVDVTVDGYAGKQLTLAAPASFEGCTLSPDGPFVWQLPLGTNSPFIAGQRSRLWIVEVDGQRLVIDLPEVPGQTAQERADAQAVFDSIQIEPAN